MIPVVQPQKDKQVLSQPEQIQEFDDAGHAFLDEPFQLASGLIVTVKR